MQFHSRSLKILYMFLYIVSYYKLNILSKKKKKVQTSKYHMPPFVFLKGEI